MPPDGCSTMLQDTEGEASGVGGVEKYRFVFVLRNTGWGGSVEKHQLDRET